MIYIYMVILTFSPFTPSLLLRFLKAREEMTGEIFRLGLFQLNRILATVAVDIRF